MRRSWKENRWCRRKVDDHSQYKRFCKTLQNFLRSDCFQVQHFSTSRCQSAVSHAAPAFTGPDKASLVCQGVRQKVWKRAFFYFIWNLLLLKHAAAAGSPRVLAPGLSVNFGKSLPLSTLFLLRLQPSKCVGARCTYSTPDSCQYEYDIYQFCRTDTMTATSVCTITPHALRRVRWKLTTFWFRGLVEKCSLPLGALLRMKVPGNCQVEMYRPVN